MKNLKTFSANFYDILEACYNHPRFFLDKGFELLSDANTTSAQMDHFTDFTTFFTTKHDIFIISIKHGD